MRILENVCHVQSYKLNINSLPKKKASALTQTPSGSQKHSTMRIVGGGIRNKDWGFINSTNGLCANKSVVSSAPKPTHNRRLKTMTKYGQWKVTKANPIPIPPRNERQKATRSTVAHGAATDI